MRYQGAEGSIAQEKINLQCLENIWKDWGETWTWEKKEGLSEGSNQPNSDDNIVAEAWVLYCTDTNILKRIGIPLQKNPKW